MDNEVKEKARAEKPKDEPKAKAEKPKEQEYVPMIKSGVTRIYHKSLVGEREKDGWKVK